MDKASGSEKLTEGFEPRALSALTGYLDTHSETLTGLLKKLEMVEELEMARDKAVAGDRRKMSYLINIAHEIKTPVNAISGFCQLLKECEESSENRQKFINIILESSTNLVSIVNKVLEISQFESGITGLSEKEVNIVDLVNEVSEKFARDAESKRLSFSREILIAPSNSLVLTDREKVIQILSNIFSNALKSTFSGGIKIKCEIVDTSIRFQISDTGTGIPKEIQSYVFSHFLLEGNTLFGSSSGAGLGLVISKGYVEKLGGKIWFDTVEGKGSDFYFTIPYKPCSASSGTKMSEFRHTVSPTQKKKRILVAEDDDLNYALVNNYLAKTGAEVIRAANGKEAVDYCFSNEVDLVLMDIRMPVMDGYIATRKIRETNPDLIVIAQTAYASDRETFLAKGFDNFIAKPYSKQQMIDMLNNYL
jgi:signal transduction histidine kinase/CheY-like chemotaxis protein